MHKAFAVVALCLFWMSAASAKDAALDYRALEGKGHTAVVATTGKPEFFFEDSVLSNFPVGSILNMMGEKKGLKKGDEIARQFGIPDPALRISQEIANALSAKLGVEATYAESAQVETPSMLWSKRKPQAWSRHSDRASSWSMSVRRVGPSPSSARIAIASAIGPMRKSWTRRAAKC